MLYCAVVVEKKLAQKKCAAVGNPTINAVLKSLYRFPTEEQALRRIQQLRAHFVTSKHSPASPDDAILFVTSKHSPASPDTAILWVRGYALTEAEIQQGYTGNF